MKRNEDKFDNDSSISEKEIIDKFKINLILTIDINQKMDQSSSDFKSKLVNFVVAIP